MFLSFWKVFETIILEMFLRVNIIKIVLIRYTGNA